MRASRFLLAVAIVALTTGCIADAKTTQQLCEEWQKNHAQDPSCGTDPAQQQGGSSGGTSSGGTSSGGGDPYEGKACQKSDHDALKEKGDVWGQIGNCYRGMFFVGNTCFLLGSNCVRKCLNENTSASPNCTTCLTEGNAQNCVKENCKTWCDASASDAQCGECVEQKCRGDIDDCVPTSAQ